MALLLLSNLHMCPHVIQATTLVQKLTFELGDGSVGVTQLTVDYSVSNEVARTWLQTDLRQYAESNTF